MALLYCLMAQSRLKCGFMNQQGAVCSCPLQRRAGPRVSAEHQLPATAMLKHQAVSIMAVLHCHTLYATDACTNSRGLSRGTPLVTPRKGRLVHSDLTLDCVPVGELRAHLAGGWTQAPWIYIDTYTYMGALQSALTTAGFFRQHTQTELICNAMDSSGHVLACECGQ